jgi:hypothetical protein
MPLTPQLNRNFDKNLMEECKAAFICITSNSSDKLKSKVQLLKGKFQLESLFEDIFFLIFHFL